MASYRTSSEAAFLVSPRQTVVFRPVAKLPHGQPAGISAFRKAWDLSVPTFYRLRKKGLMPEVLAIGGRRVITAEAEQAWADRMRRRSDNVSALGG